MSSREIIFAAAGASGPPTYIEDVFSTWLYTGNGSTQTITNGIDLSGKGGLVWTKSRNGTTSNFLNDSARGVTNVLSSNGTDAEFSATTGITAFNSNGYSLGSRVGYNTNADTYASWTFRKQPKFFDVVTYTGNGSADRLISHSLGSAPGMVFIKCTSNAENWPVVFSPGGIASGLYLNTTGANLGGFANQGTSTTYNVGLLNGLGPFTMNEVNASGRTYVMYLFAHDAGGFGLSGNDNVISCGSYTGTGATGNAITLGYEPQFLLIKRTDVSGQEWVIFDSMRGLVTGSGGDAQLFPNLSNAEAIGTFVAATATGFTLETTIARYNASGGTYIYMAIRRGPMKTPTSGTSVFNTVLYTETIPNPTTLNAGFVTDMVIHSRLNNFPGHWITPRLTNGYIPTYATDAEAANDYGWDRNNGIAITSFFNNISGIRDAVQMFRRAPGFFDVVCYTGTGGGGNQTLSHNLGVVPELMIFKRRNSATNGQWNVGWNFGSSAYSNAVLNLIQEANFFGYTTNLTFLGGQPTATNITVRDGSTDRNYSANVSGATYVAYLFASVAGVSKFGTYTGTGGTQTINAGLPTGARFVMIKRSDFTGGWFVWDTARGMVAGTDPRLALNSTAAEVNQNWVYTVTNGFQIVTTDASVNASGGSYIYLAIA